MVFLQHGMSTVSNIFLSGLASSHGPMEICFATLETNACNSESTKASSEDWMANWSPQLTPIDAIIQKWHDQTGHMVSD